MIVFEHNFSIGDIRVLELRFPCHDMRKIKILGVFKNDFGELLT